MDLLVKDADKLTLGHSLTTATPHALEGVLKQPPDQWLSNACLIHYQALLLNPTRMMFPPLRTQLHCCLTQTWKCPYMTAPRL